MVNIKEIKNHQIVEKLSELESKRGILRMAVYEILENYEGKKPNEYIAHLNVARQILEKANYEENSHYNTIAGINQREKYPFATTDFDKLDSSGIKITLEEFIGVYFDLTLNKPLILDKYSYFYFDKKEKTPVKVEIDKKIKDFSIKHYETHGLMYALMNPPYGVNFGNTIKERSDYVLEFIEYFFNDLQQIEIYTWNTDCSSIFDAGNDWWGSFFWTIYNPIKQWYIGIIASETD